MEKALLGTKLGMTQVFDQSGKVTPVTVIEAGPCTVVQKKTVDKDGYNAVVLAFGKVRENLKNKPELGLFKKAHVEAKKYLREFQLDGYDTLEVGNEIKCSVLAEGELVDVTGTSKGHGFSGIIKRWNARRLRMSHGTGPVHREVGGLSANSTPSRVFKNRKMPGQFGGDRVTKQNLKVVKIDEEKNIVMVKGSVPGAKGSLVIMQSAKKAPRK